MALYTYDYVDAGGRRRSGTLEAQGDQDAKAQLRERGVVVTRLQVSRKIASAQHLRGEHLLAFTIQLSQLVNAGVPLYESLVALEEQARGHVYQRVLLGLCEHIKAGMSLSAAMALYPDSFDRLYRGMVAAGEAVGAVGPVLDKLSYFLSRQSKLKKQIITAMIYPAILGGFSLLIIALLLGFVIPSLKDIFAERKLNGFTQLILGVSDVFRTYWWALISLTLGAIIWSVWKLRSPQGRVWLERHSLKVPLIKGLVVQTVVARFSRTMGTLLQGGVSMIDALRISRGIMRNVVLEGEIQLAEKRIIEGRALSQELARSAYLPSLMARMLRVGEESGTTVVMLNRIADMYEQELEKTLDRVMALAQPVILIVMGIVIGAVLLAVLLPLTDVSAFSTG